MKYDPNLHIIVRFLAPSIISILTLSAFSYAGETTYENITQHITKLSEMLENEPHGFGSPASDRETWESIARQPAFNNCVHQAENLMDTPVPKLPDDLFLDFSKTGNRYRYETPLSQRRSILNALVLGECIENAGRFMPAIEQYLKAHCSQRTWVLPAHDLELQNFYGRQTDIDLNVAHTSWNLATTDYLLGDKLSIKTRELIRDEIRRRTFDPFLEMVRTGENLVHWLTGTNNWNSVCLSGVVGAALILIESKDERAWFLLGAERYSPYYLDGFTDDGYCTEGLSYWNYGFGHYIMLAEAVKQATDGKWDLLAQEKIENIARFPLNLEIFSGVYPSFADSGINAGPSARYMRYLNHRFGFGIDTWEQSGRQAVGQIYEIALFAVRDPFANSASSARTKSSRPLHSWFGDAEVLISRHESITAAGFGAAMKGGNNGDNHNHNDIGSYLAVLNGKVLLIDPGPEVYTARTFSDRRYESDVLNSYGHPVPVLAGQLQKTGKDAHARVVSKQFADENDELVLDISSAYDVSTLEKIERHFVFSREDKGSLTVTDTVVFSSPETVETALITFCEWRTLKHGSLLVFDNDDAVRVDIETTGSDFELTAHELDENLALDMVPLRIGIRLKKPVEQTEIKITITPAPANR